MDTGSIIQLIAIIVLLFLSAFFSSAETALTTVSRIKIRSLIDEGSRRAVIVDSIINKPAKMLSAILIGNNLVNITCTTLATTFTINMFGSYATGFATCILTILVLIFGEITPKNLAATYSVKLSLAFAPIIRVLMVIFTPVIILVDAVSGMFLKLFRIDFTNKKKTITEQDLRTFVKVSHEDGVIENSEKQIINNLFDFGDSIARDVMIPRIDMTLASVASTYEDILQLFRDTMYTRIPLYEDNPDNVIGILNIKDLILASSDEAYNLKNIMRKPFYTYEYKNTSDLFKEMQHSSTSIAIVLDEYGSTAGMITTEDLLEEIVGEIRDEYDTDEHDAFRKINEKTFRVDAAYKLDDLNEALGTKLIAEDNDSVGGLITEQLDRIPKAGDSVIIGNIRLFVEKSSSNRAESVIIRLL